MTEYNPEKRFYNRFVGSIFGAIGLLVTGVGVHEYFYPTSDEQRIKFLEPRVTAFEQWCTRKYAAKDYYGSTPFAVEHCLEWEDGIYGLPGERKQYYALIKGIAQREPAPGG